MLSLGVLMVILGTIAFFIAPVATIGMVIVLGWLLVVSVLLKQYTLSGSTAGAASSFICSQAPWGYLSA